VKANERVSDVVGRRISSGRTAELPQSAPTAGGVPSWKVDQYSVSVVQPGWHQRDHQSVERGWRSAAKHRYTVLWTCVCVCVTRSASIYEQITGSTAAPLISSEVVSS